MDLGWKVMLPWGLVNLVAVAVWMEFGDGLAKLVGLATERSMAAIGWGVMLLTWLVTVAVDPTRGNNRPRRGSPTGRTAGP